MKIIVRNGKVVSIKDSGDIRQQLDNINAAILELQKLAYKMRRVSCTVLNENSALMQAYDQLAEEKRRADIGKKAAERTAAAAEKQIKRNNAERKQA